MCFHLILVSHFNLAIITHSSFSLSILYHFGLSNLITCLYLVLPHVSPWLAINPSAWKALLLAFV